MELRQLEHFVAVAEERSFTRAARRAQIVQSGISASIRALEQELDAQLLVRRPRDILLTPEGEALLVDAYRVLAAVRHGIESVSAVQGKLRGTLALGITTVLPLPMNLAAMLQQFHELHPGIRVRLRQSASRPLFEALAAGTLDLIIAGAPPRPVAGVHSRVLARSPLQLACSLQHRLARKRSVALADLVGETFIDVTTDWSSRLEADAAFARADLTRDVSFELGDPSSLVALVARGLGVAIVPAMINQGREKVQLVAIEPALPDWTLIAAHRGAQPSTLAAQAFLAMVTASEDAER